MQEFGLSSSSLKEKMESYISSPIVKSFLAGSFSGTCSTIIFQPLDLVKTRLQSPVAIGKTPSGVFTVIANVVKSEKVVGLWKGVVPSLTRTVPGIGVYFCSLSWMRTNLGSADPAPLESVCIGALARAVSGISMLPFTVVKTRYESGFFQYNGVIHALQSIYKGEGAKGLYSGLAATLLRDAPFSGLYLMFYTELKKYARKTGWYDGQNPMFFFSCGIIAGCAASIVTQPADVIKTHMQLYPHKFSNIRAVVMHVHKHEGTVGFVRGVIPRTMRRTLMAAMAWTVFEQLMKSVGLKKNM